MDEKKHKIIDWLGSSHGLPLKNTICLLKVSDIETEAPPSLPLPANPYRSYNISCYVEQRVSRYAHYMEDVEQRSLSRQVQCIQDTGAGFINAAKTLKGPERRCIHCIYLTMLYFTLICSMPRAWHNRKVLAWWTERQQLHHNVPTP